MTKSREKNIVQVHNLGGFIAKWLSDRNLKNNSDFYLALFNTMKKDEPDLKLSAVTRSMQNYLNGDRKISGRYLTAVCSILSITPEDIFDEIAGLWKTDASFTKEILSLVRNYSNDIGLKDSFVSYLKEIIPDPDFPIHAPLKPAERPISSKVDPPRYTRYQLAEAYESDTDSQYQRKIEDKTVTLSKADLQFMLEVQNKVDDYIAYLCWQRSEEMKKEEAKATEKYVTVTNGEKGTVKTVHPLSVEQINEIDRFNQYWLKQ